MNSLEKIVEGLPNDILEIVEKDANRIHRNMVHQQRMQASKTRAMPAPELHTAPLGKNPNRRDARDYIHFEFEGQLYVLTVNTVADYKGISLRKAHGNDIDYDHLDFLDHVEYLENLDPRDAWHKANKPTRPDPDRLLYFMTYYDYSTAEIAYIVKVIHKDAKTRTLMKALLTLVRRVFPMATLENIVVEMDQSYGKYTLPEFMEGLKNVQGGANANASVTFERRVYKLHPHKTNGPYITVNKVRVFLKDIRRRYRFSR